MPPSTSGILCSNTGCFHIISNANLCVCLCGWALSTTCKGGWENKNLSHCQVASKYKKGVQICWVGPKGYPLHFLTCHSPVLSCTAIMPGSISDHLRAKIYICLASGRLIQVTCWALSQTEKVRGSASIGDEILRALCSGPCMSSRTYPWYHPDYYCLIEIVWATNTSHTWNLKFASF